MERTAGFMESIEGMEGFQASGPCIFFFNKFIYLFLAVLGLRCCARAFSSCGKWVATLCRGAQASHCGSFCCCETWALGAQTSVVVACGL